MAGAKGGQRGVPCSVACWSDLPLLPNPVSCLRCTPHSHPHKMVPGPDHAPPSPLCLGPPTPVLTSHLHQASVRPSSNAASSLASPPQSELLWHSFVSLRACEPWKAGAHVLHCWTAWCPVQQRLPKWPLGSQTNGRRSLPSAWPPQAVGSACDLKPSQLSYI